MGWRPSQTASTKRSMQWRDAIGCASFFGCTSGDEALAAFGFDWHLKHLWGC
jgi:hypothetical protein